MADSITVAFVHQIDPRFKTNSWVGSLRSFERTCERYIGSVVDLGASPFSLFPYRAARKLTHALTGRRYSFHHDPAFARRAAAYFTETLRGATYDLIFAVSAAHIVSYLKTDIPIIYYSDATWRVARDYYGDYKNLIRRSHDGGDDLERRAIARSSILIYPSEWGAESAIRDYGADPSKVFVVAPGPNLTDPPKREDVLPRKPGRKIRLLLVGVSWEIKGGDIAREALVRLLEMGYDAELTVVGCTAPDGVSHPRMRVIPFLDKNVPEERERFLRCWREADFFILPSRYEAAGMVCCEASAYALPVIASHTGGLPSLVREGVNGYTIPLDARGDRYAELIATIASDREGYAALCVSTRNEFENRLNWDRWGERVAEIVGEKFSELRDKLLDRRKLQSGIAPTV